MWGVKLNAILATKEREIQKKLMTSFYRHKRSYSKIQIGQVVEKEEFCLAAKFEYADIRP